MAIENKLGLTSFTDLAREEERIKGSSTGARLMMVFSGISLYFL